MTFLCQPFFPFILLEISYALRDILWYGMYIRFKTTDKFFDLTWFRAKSKTFLTQEHIYGEGTDLMAHTEEVIKSIMDICDLYSKESM